ncbi:hypothetical protein FF38_09918 [Lucilia cuprina]|uniref:C2H2-type domain-containing protein n=1 Tax=Lucilia cuprina TaxID=7375 RepID=A0A0L0CF74_LUCCU|nr:hypothetical protein FF38_09918 [Lucilia cuprina]
MDLFAYNTPSTSTSAKLNLEMMKRNEGRGSRFECKSCNETFPTLCSLHNHKTAQHKRSWGTSNMFSCEHCDLNFKGKMLLKKHMRMHNLQPKINLDCKICGRIFKIARGLENHSKIHQSLIHSTLCNIDVERLDWLHYQRTRKHIESGNGVKDVTSNISLRSSDFMERVEIYTYTNPKLDDIYVEDFFQNAEGDVLKIL